MTSFGDLFDGLAAGETPKPDGQFCLVVDDAAVVRRFVSGMFRELGYRVAEAHNGLQALEFCRRETPDIILLDWNMPEMDGLTCLKRLRAFEFERRPVIMMCTTENQIGRIEQALEAGADEYIMKPFDRGVLSDKLAQLGFIS